MRNVSAIVTSAGLALLLATLGCAHTQIATADRALNITYEAPGEPATGYVEFSSLHKEAVVPIYLFDDQARPHLLAGTGLRRGDYYSLQCHQTRVAEIVRVALPPGFHTFMIEKDGCVVRARVEPGKVTLVEIDYVLVHRGVSFVLYQATCQAFDPVPVKGHKRG